MGNCQNLNLIYNTPIEGDSDSINETKIYRHPDYTKELIKNDPGHTILTNYKMAFEKYSDLDFLGQRKKDNNGNLLNEFEFFTYKEVNEKINILGSNIIERNLAPEKKEYKNYNLRFIGVYSVNTLNWYLTELACCTQNVTTVPIYDTLGEEAVKFAFTQTNMDTLFLSSKHFKKIMENINNKNYVLKNLVIMDSENFDEEMKNDINEKVNVIFFEDLLIKEKIIPWADVKPDDIYTFSYTSGTTGEPKGAMLSHKNMISFINGANIKIKFEYHEVYLSYLPLPHVFEKVMYNKLLIMGSKIGLFNGNILKLTEDINILKPTFFATVPRLLLKFYEAIKKQFEETGYLKKLLINYAVNRKLEQLRQTGEVKYQFFDNLIFKKIKEKFGGNIRMMLTGSAPISGDILDFLKICFCCTIYEAYGQTEGCGGEFSTSDIEILNEHVGGVFPNWEFKLVDILDMGYTNKDKDKDNNPSPRGEIWVRGESIFQGYYKNEEKTKESLTEDGWLKSGDVGQILYQGNRLKIIDRKKNIFKLSQGEYIAPEKLESAFKLHKYIDDIFVYGDSMQSRLVSIISIEENTMKNLCEEWKIGFNNNLEELKKNELIRNKLFSILNEIHTEKKFNGIERIKKFYIETTPFIQLDLVTSSFKLKRNNIKIYYKNIVDDLYKELNNQNN